MSRTGTGDGHTPTCPGPQAWMGGSRSGSSRTSFYLETGRNGGRDVAPFLVQGAVTAWCEHGACRCRVVGMLPPAERGPSTWLPSSHQLPIREPTCAAQVGARTPTAPVPPGSGLGTVEGASLSTCYAEHSGGGGDSGPHTLCSQPVGETITCSGHSDAAGQVGERCPRVLGVMGRRGGQVSCLK